MIRLFDIILSLFGLILLSPILLLLLIIGIIDTGSPVFRQKRVGKNQHAFILVKFRTMNINTESVGSHLVKSDSITKFGRFLRKTKLDELPQLWNVLKGDMSLVGPRPNLYNQHSLINERTMLRVYEVRPGITGESQINEIDMSTPKLLAMTDAKMIRELNMFNYFKFIFRTATGKGQGDRASKN